MISNIHSIGKHTYGHNNIQVVKWFKGNASAGSFCSIGANVKIFLDGNHRTDFVTTFPFGHTSKDTFKTDIVENPVSKGDVVIGNDVWIATNVTIMSGVKIGDGAVIANNSHVVKDVEPYSIVGGNPAKLIRYRFTRDQIDNLLKIKWWEWPDEKINRYIPLLLNDNIDNFISEALKETSC